MEITFNATRMVPENSKIQIRIEEVDPAEYGGSGGFLAVAASGKTRLAEVGRATAREALAGLIFRLRGEGFDFELPFLIEDI